MKRGMADATEIVRLIFERAAKARASDVHIEPTEEALRIRFRVDGVLVDQGTVSLSDHDQIMTRIKVLSALDITARPTPQDGHFELDLSTYTVAQAEKDAASENRHPETELGMMRREKRIIDIRVSIFPTVNGEAAVCRLLNRSETLFSLDDLGFDTETLKKVRALITRSYGMVLITGPTGAGKTTALYSILQEVMGKEKSVVTLEDPVEFRFAGVRQTQIQPERGLTFAVGMKSILRQDPDIIMIGEIRDQETAEHAVRASLVGRIIFSTIHSNTTVGTIARLLDMNIERSMIAYALSGVISTRLVRKNCQKCLTEYVPDEQYLSFFGVTPGTVFRRGAGCDACKGIGLAGRIGVFEVLTFDNPLRALIIDKAPMAALEAYALESGMKTLKQDSLEKARAGLVTLENAARAV